VERSGYIAVLGRLGPGRPQSARLFIFAIVSALALAGCNAGYITHAAYEEVRILLRRKPITEELMRADLPASTRAKLETVLAVRKFAAD
jgi:predicted aminopeptidase